MGEDQLFPMALTFALARAIVRTLYNAWTVANIKMK